MGGRYDAVWSPVWRSVGRHDTVWAGCEVGGRNGAVWGRNDAVEARMARCGQEWRSEGVNDLVGRSELCVSGRECFIAAVISRLTGGAGA